MDRHTNTVEEQLLWEATRRFGLRDVSAKHKESLQAYKKRYGARLNEFYVFTVVDLFTEESETEIECDKLSLEHYRIVFSVDKSGDYPFKDLSWFQQQESPKILGYWCSERESWCFVPLQVPKTLKEEMVHHSEEILATDEEAQEIVEQIGGEWDILGSTY